MPTDWEQLAAWYDQRQGDDGDLWHRTLIDPALLQMVGPVDGLQVLDLACGNGYVARRLARLGASVTGVDASAPVIQLAREREARDPLDITYHVADAASLTMLEDLTFDLIVSNMALMDIADAAGALREAARVLRTGGRFVASLSHPCFDTPNASAWMVEQMTYTSTIWRKVSRYREIFDSQIAWRTPGGFRYTTAYHRPLSWYVRSLCAAGFVLTALDEPEPTEEFIAGSPQGSWMAEIPLHVVLEARKLRAPGTESAG